MSESPQGYQIFWKRVARHVGISQAAKAIGVRATAISAFEKGEAHTLSDEQIAALDAYLESVPVPEPEVPEIVDDEEPAEP